MNVELRIEELVLHGFPPANHHRVAGALQRELSRLLSEGGMPGASPADLSYLGRLNFEAPRDAAETEIGVRAARSLYEGLAP